jgi:uncharacterized protein involved in exopolysaccharide biosynthesis
MVLFFLAAMAGAAGVTVWIPRTYQSEAKLMVRLGRENTTSRENEPNSVLEILSSRNLIEKVADSLGPEAILSGAAPAPLPERGGASLEDPEPPKQIDDRYRALAALQKAFKFEAVKNSNVVTVSCEAMSPATAQAAVSRLIDFALDRHMALQRTPGAYRFLAEQEGRLTREVQKTEQELLALKNQTGITTPENQRLILANRLGRIEDELLQTAAAQAAAQAEVQALEKQLEGMPKTQVTATTRGVPNQGADLMRGQFYALQVRAQEALARHPEGHPEVRSLRNQTAAAKQLLDQEEPTREQVTTGPNRIYENLQQSLVRQRTQLATLRGRRAALLEQREAERVVLKGFTADEMQVNRLQRRFDLEVSQHRKYAENLEQARIDQALQTERISNISVVQPASYDVGPLRPRWSVNLGFGLLLALTGSIGIALLAEQWRTAAADPERLRPTAVVLEPHLFPLEPSAPDSAPDGCVSPGSSGTMEEDAEPSKDGPGA